MKLSEYKLFNSSLDKLEVNKILITTLNAHSFNIAKIDTEFNNALINSDVLLPDGISIVLAKRLISKQKIKKIAGADLFNYEMNRLNAISGTCLFLGSSESTLSMIKQKASIDFANVQIFTYSPPFKKEFSEEDNSAMISIINDIKPDVLFVGMTAPKQEKWAFRNFKIINATHICCIGAVFDFYAGTIKRAPNWMIQIGLEWLFRLVNEPKRMWKRYIIGNTKFVFSVLIEKILDRV